jgi:post-segregation antitoxin (ccd killing protein)
MRKFLKDPVVISLYVSAESRERARRLNVNISEICRESLEKKLDAIENKLTPDEEWDCQP